MNKETLWKHHDFRRLWTGESISLLGSQVTVLAIPLSAATILHASPFQMGLLTAVQYLPYLLFSLPAGAWIDRYPRRPFLIASNLGRALLLSIIPVAYWLGFLHIGLLIAISFLVGTFATFFELAYTSYLPTLVSKEQLTEGNSKLQTSASVAQTGGPGLAGLLIGLWTAPAAILVNSLSYLVSVYFLLRIRSSEPRHKSKPAASNLWHEIGEGIKLLTANRYLVAVLGEASTYNFFSQAALSVVTLYFTGSLGLGATMIGLLYTTSSLGAVAGSFSADRMAKRMGLGPAILITMSIACVSTILIPLAGLSGGLAVAILLPAYFLSGFGIAVSVIHCLSLRQTVAPPEIQGRIFGAYRFFSIGAASLGGLAGGWLGEAIGISPTLFVASAGMIAALAWVFASPIVRLQKLEDALTPSMHDKRGENTETPDFSA